MSIQIISKADNVKMFVREYYFGQKTWAKISRIVSGPIVLLCGILLLNKAGKFFIAYGGFCLVYGLYYTLYPILIIVFRKSLFRKNSFELSLTEEELRGKKEGIESIFKLDYFRSIVRRPTYYKLTTKSANVIYLIAEQLTQGERQILDSHLT